MAFADSGLFGYGRALDAVGDDPELYAQFQADRNRQLIANMLLQRGQQQPQGQMVGRFYVPPSPLQHVGSMVNTLAGLGALQYGDKERAEGMKTLKERRQQELAKAISQMSKDLSPTKQVEMEAQGPGAPVATPEGQSMTEMINASETPALLPGAQEYGSQSQPFFREGPRPTGMQEVPKGQQEIMAARMQYLAHSRPEIRDLAKYLDQQQVADANAKQQADLAERMKWLDASIQAGLKGIATKDAQDKLNFEKEKFGTPSADTLQKTADQLAVRDKDGNIIANEPAIAARERIAKAGKATTDITTNVGPEETAYEKELGKERAKRVGESLTAAEDARDVIDTIHQGKKLLSSPIITGFGAEWLTSAGQALKRIGFDVGGDAVSNAQAYAATMANNVGKIIKQFGAGTGLSDADREYAEKMAAGKITLEKDAILKILNMREAAARNIIRLHNKKVKERHTDFSVQEPDEFINQGAKPSTPLSFDDPEKERKYQQWKSEQK